MNQNLLRFLLPKGRFYQWPIIIVGLVGLTFNNFCPNAMASTKIKSYEKKFFINADGILKGKVTDKDGLPIPGVTISIKSINLSTVSDVNGKFELKVPAGNYELTATFVGMDSFKQTVVIKDQVSQEITIVLKESSKSLNEVVVVGYGTQSKRNVTGSISSVKGDEIKNIPSSNPSTALQGRVPGVDIVRNDGTPGTSPSIRIRGTGTINNADPLIIIDGVPAGGLNDVNPNDIDSFEILKDASAAAIYGSRAANGVVIITTKKGNFNQSLKTTVNLYAGTNSPVKFLNMLTAPDLAKLKIESYTNDGLTPPTIWSNPYYSVQRTDWQKALMGTGNVQNADIAVRGGSTSSIYSISGNYYNENGFIPNSLFNRYNFRVNTEHKVNSAIKIGENVLYSNSNNTTPDTRSTQAGLVWSAIRFNPAIPITNPDGSYGSSQADNQLGDINNPVATAKLTDAYNKSSRLLANAFAEIEFLKGLKLKANYSYDNTLNDFYNFQVPQPLQTRGPSTATLNQGYSKSTTLLEEYFLTYNRVFNKNEINLIGGYSAQTIKGNYVNASRTGFSDIDPNQRVLNLGSSANNSGNNIPSEGLQSYFVRGNYAYDNKYLLTITMRADGSSKFAQGKQWGYFPAFSTGWRISDESFYGDGIKKIFNNLKITGGWGQLGNQNIGNFQYLSTLGYGSGYGYALGTNTVLQNGAFITGLANPNITWERTAMTNIALEFSTLENHLDGIITFYDKKTTDMLIPYQLVETFGAQTNLPDDPGNITLPNQNIGSMDNKGIEVELNYHNTLGKLKYSIGANISFLNNKVTKLYGKSAYIASTPYGRENVDISRTYEGQPIASFYGFKTNGLYQTQADINSDPSIKNDPNKANIKPGDVRFLDVNGDGIVDDKDRVNLGDPNPKYVFGFHGNVNYKNFDFSFNFSGAAGFKLYNADRLAGLDGTQVFNWYSEQLGRWTGPNTSNSIPRLTNSNLNNNYRSSDLWVENGAYLSLKSIALGYTFNKSNVGGFQIPSIRAYVSSYNVLMLTGYKGYTPELGYTSSGNSPANSQKGVDVAQYPSARNITFGLSTNF